MAQPIPTPTPAQHDPIFWAATLLKKAGLPDATISQILGDAANPALYTVPTPANPGAPAPSRGMQPAIPQTQQVEAPGAGIFLPGPQDPIRKPLDVTAGAGGAPVISAPDILSGLTGDSAPQPPTGRYGPAPEALVQRKAQADALRQQLKSLGLSDQEIEKRVATVMDPMHAVDAPGGPMGSDPQTPSALQQMVQQFSDWFQKQTAGAPQQMQGTPGGAARDAAQGDIGNKLLLQAAFGNNPRQLPSDIFPVPPAAGPNAAAMGAAAGAAAPTDVVMKGPPGTGPAPGPATGGPTTITQGFNNTRPSPDQLSPTQLASIRPAASSPAAATPGQMDVTKTTPTSDWGWEDLLNASLRLMAAGEPAPGATRGPSLLGAVGQAGAQTMAAKQKQRADAAEIALKGRELDIKQQDVTETGKLRQQLQEYDRTDKEIQRRLQGMTVNTQAYTAISGIRDGYAKELDKLQTSLPYLDALGKDPAAAAKMVKDLQDKRDADIAAVQEGVGAGTGTASPGQKAASNGPGPNTGTGPLGYVMLNGQRYVKQADGWHLATGP